MEIRRQNIGSLVIRGKKESILIDPQESSEITERIVIYSKKRDIVPKIDEKVIIAGPGEYEVGGVEIVGIRSGDEGDLIYLLAVDGVKIGLLPNSENKINDKKIDRIGELDVLLVNIDEKNGGSAKFILGIARKLGANYVIPFGYSEGNESIKGFLDESDDEGKEEVDSLKVEKMELPEGMEVVLLKIKNG